MMRSMRGDDHEPESMFSYVSPEQRIPTEHPLRTIRALVVDVLGGMSREFDGLYAAIGRPSIPPGTPAAGAIASNLLGDDTSTFVGHLSVFRPLVAQSGLVSRRASPCPWPAARRFAAGSPFEAISRALCQNRHGMPSSGCL